MPPVYVGERAVIARYIGSRPVQSVMYRGQNLLGASFPITDLDFTSGLPAAFTMTRGGSDRLARAANGKWARYAGAAPRVHCNEIGMPLGLVLERSCVDKGRLGFNFAAAPSDTSGGFFTAPTGAVMTPDPVSLAQVGFDSILTSSIRLVAPSADTTFQLKGSALTLAPHSMFGLVRDAIGTGGGSFSSLSISSGSPFTPMIFDEWTMISREQITPTTISKIGQAAVRMGHNFDLAGFWFVEAPYAPLPYWRSADNVQATISDEWASAPLAGFTGYSATETCVIYYEWYHDRPFSVDGEPLIVFGDSGASGDYVKIGGRADGTLRIEGYIGGAVVFSSDFAAPARNAAHVAAIRFQAGAWMAAVDGVASAGAAISPNIANLNTCYLNKHGASYGNQFARNLTIAKTALGDAAFAAGSAINGGVI